MRRRHFLLAGAAAGIGTGLALWRQRVHSAVPEHAPALRRDPAGLLDLLPGFHCSIVQRAGEPMDDGHRMPALPDGMACFEDAQGRWVLMRNHELDVGQLAYGAFPPGSPLPGEMYDRQAAGGVSRVVIDPERRVRVSSNLVLAGTARNCAGGPSPWGWLSCEESERPGHGFVFLCPVEADRVHPPRRIPSYGRFNHEAVAIDPQTLAAYLTEDKVDSCLYRMQPPDRERPFEGPLEALCLPDEVHPDTGRLPVGKEYPVHWVKVPSPVPDASPSTRRQAQALGAAIVRRGEGIWYADGSVFFTATVGGPANAGQVFELRLTPEGGQLRILAQSDDLAELDMPDNLTVTPWGDLLVCEDGPGANYLRLLTRAGHLTPFARNAAGNTELAGVCFSPDGRALFVNLQHQGLTLMVTGPFEQLASGRSA